MKINLDNFISMLDIQAGVNDVIRPKAKWTPGVVDFLTAFEVEFWELVNAISLFKFWKHSHVLNREKILDELADCFAFFLSAILTLPQEIAEENGAMQYPRMHALEEVMRSFDSMQTALDEATSEEQRHAIVLHLMQEVALIGENSEHKQIGSIAKFAAAITLVVGVFQDITWDEISAAYSKKSQENIDRQSRSY